MDKGSLPLMHGPVNSPEAERRLEAQSRASVENSPAQKDKPVSPVKAEQSRQETEAPTANRVRLADVNLKFQVDPETQEVTVLILDRATRKVIRTIPAEEIKKIRPGELFDFSS